MSRSVKQPYNYTLSYTKNTTKPGPSPKDRHRFTLNDKNFDKPLFRDFTRQSVSQYHDKHVTPFTDQSHPQKSYQATNNFVRGTDHSVHTNNHFVNTPTDYDNNQFAGIQHGEDLPEGHPSSSNVSTAAAASIGYAAQQGISGFAQSQKIANRPTPGQVGVNATELDVAHPSTPAPGAGLLNAREKEAKDKEQSINTWETVGNVATTVGIGILSVL